MIQRIRKRGVNVNVFEIIGPVMIGPSSSHTAGACALGFVANRVLNEGVPVRADIQLSGSFARTYRGHGTDKALLAGIMGYHSDSAEIRNILKIASNAGLQYSFTPEDIPGAHPNTARIRLTSKSGKTCEVQGASIGGGNIRVDEVNGMKVDFTGEYNTILVLHHDKPGLIADVTNLMKIRFPKLNISNFRLTRQKRGGDAMMIIEIDGLPPKSLIRDISSIPDVENAVLVRSV